MNDPETGFPPELVRQACQEVVGLPAADRESFLHQRYPHNKALWKEVLSLMEHDSPLEDPLGQGIGPLLTTFHQANGLNQTATMPTIRGYEGFEKIATGGQGVVYRARQVSTGQTVAVKVVLEGSLSPTAVERLQKEARLLADLQHPNIVTVIDQPQTECGSTCLVTRFIRGLPLDEFARQLHQNRWAVLGGICKRIAEAVDAAHRSGVVHRDLKPSNILVDDNDEPFILDFGLAKFLPETTHGEPSGCTEEGRFLGSVAWASPEQVDQSLGPVAPQTDIYQLGVIFYQLVSGGAFPYPIEGGYPQIFNRILHDKPAKLVNDELSPSQRAQLDSVLQRALNKTPQDRFPSAAELGQAVADGLREAPHAHRTGQGPRWRSSVSLLTGGGILLLLSAAGVGMWFPQSAPPSQRDSSSEVAPKASGAIRPTERISQPMVEPEPSEDLSAAESLVDVAFADLRAPHLPDGWQGDGVAFVDGGQLTVPRGTRRPAMVSTGSMRVPGDWLLVVEHLAAANGVLRVSLFDGIGATVDLTIHRGRLQFTEGRTEKTKTLGRRTLSVRREGDRLIALLQGAQPIHVDATDFRELLQVRFGLSNSGSGGGEVAVHRVQLKQVITKERN